LQESPRPQQKILFDAKLPTREAPGVCYYSGKHCEAGAQVLTHNLADFHRIVKWWVDKSAGSTTTMPWDRAAQTAAEHSAVARCARAAGDPERWCQQFTRLFRRREPRAPEVSAETHRLDAGEAEAPQHHRRRQEIPGFSTPAVAVSPWTCRAASLMPYIQDATTASPRLFRRGLLHCPGDKEPREDHLPTAQPIPKLRYVRGSWRT
jgi:hypothetical protein